MTYRLQQSWPNKQWQAVTNIPLFENKRLKIITTKVASTGGISTTAQGWTENDDGFMEIMLYSDFFKRLHEQTTTRVTKQRVESQHVAVLESLLDEVKQDALNFYTKKPTAN
jgi:hypothetical protein